MTIKNQSPKGGTELQFEYLEKYVDKNLLDQRKGMLDALGGQGILDTIRSEDDPNDPATLEDVRKYYNIA